MFTGCTYQITIPALSLNSPQLFFPRFSFTADRRYAFRCTVTNGGGRNNSVVVALNIVSKPITANIIGGNRNVRVNLPLTLNASISRDPDAPEAGTMRLASL